MKFRRRTLEQIADMICGNFKADTSVFPYRSSSYLSEFFADADTEFIHDGSTKNGGWQARWRPSWPSQALIRARRRTAFCA